MSYARMVELKRDIRKVQKLKREAADRRARRAYDRLEYVLTCWKDEHKGSIDV